MTARARATRQASRSTISPAARLRPLCRAIAVVLAAGTTAHAQAALNLAHVGTQPNAARGAGGGAGIANLGVGVSPQQALQQSQPSIQNLAHAVQGIARQVAAQQAAAAGAAATSNVPNGLAAGGLQVAPGVSSDTGNANLWINAGLPTQSVDASGHVNVDVKQTAQSAVLTWQTMNVGRQTTLNFDQSGGTQSNGTNNWVVLNRIQDPGGRPSQILGSITAQGAVYVVNRNGILFGAGSQVNVHSLVASAMDILNLKDSPIPAAGDIVASNQFFLEQAGGLAGLEAGQSSQLGNTDIGSPNEVLGLGNIVTVSSASQYQAPGDITIEPGASITTHANGTASDGGFVLAAGLNVTNAGSITATDGQVILAAGVGVGMSPNIRNPQVLLPELSGAVMLGNSDITPAGTLTNTGIVQAARGNIDLLGTNVNQNGVVGVTTSVSEPGGISISTTDEHATNTPLSATMPGAAYTGPGVGPVTFDGPIDYNRAGQLTFGNHSVTAVLPDTDGETATSAPGTVFTPGSVNMTVGSAWFQGGSLIEAPGSTVSVTAVSSFSRVNSQPPGDTAVQGRIYVDDGATIDVSGLANVELPIADTLVTVDTVSGNELANSPLLRDSFLNGFKNLIFDSTLSGTSADGNQWVGSPILNLAGYVDLIPRTVDQLLVNGGTITLAGNEVMTASGSSLNLNGGYIHYDGGMVNTTRLVDASGAMVPIGQASPYDTYVGVAGEFVESHPRWGVTTDWFDPLLSRGVFEPDFIVGGNAGTLSLFANQDMVLDGDMTGWAIGGEKQVQGNDQPTGGSFALGAAAGAVLTLGGTTSVNGEHGFVILQDNAPQLGDLPGGFAVDQPLDTSAINALSSSDPNNVLVNTVVPVATLDNGGFANVSATEDSAAGKGFVVAQGTTLAVQPGGSITLSDPAVMGGVTILGSLIAPSGKISITKGPGGDIVLGSGAVLSVAGQWVNNDVLAMPGTVSGDSEFINGGSIMLSTADSSTTTGAPAGTILDNTGSILLQPGSLIDVSSGGEIQSDGEMLMQDGIAEGKGGSLSLLTYFAANNQKQFGNVSAGSPPLPTSQPTHATIEMDGSIRSEGFAGGGTLALQALGFQIGGDPSQTPVGSLYLPGSFFAQQGFGNYVLSAMYDATIAPGAQIALTQQNMLPNVIALQGVPTGGDIPASGLVTSGSIDPYHRQPTSLQITAGDYLSWLTASGAPPAYAGVTGAVTFGEGASIDADAGASIGLGSPAQTTVLGSIRAPGGSIVLSGDPAISGLLLPNEPAVGALSFTSNSQSVWLGQNAVLDVSGVALINPLAAPVRSGADVIVPETGKVLAGGSVTLADDAGYVVAQAGSVIDVSGTATQFDELQSPGLYTRQPVWSDAGSITLGASSGLYFDGTLQARPGAAQAQGGTLTLIAEQSTLTSRQAAGGSVTSPRAQALVLQQGGDLVPSGLQPGQDFPDVTTISADATQNGSGVVQFSLDRLQDSGISTLVLAGAQGAQTPAPVVFAGNIDLSVSRALIIDSNRIIALDGSSVQKLFPSASASAQTLDDIVTAADQSIGAPTVNLDAPYVAINGQSDGDLSTITPVAARADGTLNVNASFIDLENQFQLNNFGAANLTSSGDIRMSSTVAGGGSGLSDGELFTAGNLTLKAADVYPSTGSSFILAAVGPGDANGQPMPTTITFLSSGTSGAPLSAGGSLLVDATDIVQSGTVRAPSGSLIFGVGDPADTATQAQFNQLPQLVATNSVTFGNGSVTSVSDDGLIIPFGTTIDGVEWQFTPSAADNAVDLTAPPAKFIGVNGSHVALDQGASIDLSGGGDLQAAEWVPGTGGSRDLLSQYNVNFSENPAGVAVPVNADGGNVYAVLPGRQAPVSAYDPYFAQSAQPSISGNGTGGTATVSAGVGSAAAGNSPVGEAVYLSGVPGLPAGYYTLLPGRYATLPGAYRVTVASASGAALPGSAQTLPDGTVMVVGYFGNALDGSRNATPTLFNVQSGAVWQQYSQYQTSGANSFFSNLAVSKGNVVPQLPIDGGQLVLAATTGLTLGASLNAAAAPGGAPAQVDIASQDIQITGNGEAALPGYLQISSDQLDALGAGSLLIGGTRTQTDSGITIEAIANSVVVANDAGDPLSGPEIMLVTKTDPTGDDPNAANGLRIEAGSVIEANGTYPVGKDVPITIGQNASSTTGTAAVSGDGAFLSVTNGGDATVTRVDTSPVDTNAGLLTVGAGASLAGGAALTLDSSGNLTFDPSASLSGNVIAVDGSAITFTDQTGAGAASLPGFVVGPNQIAQLSNAHEVILRSAGAMNFDGAVDVAFGNQVELSAGVFQSDGGTVTIDSPQITLSNDVGAPNTGGVAGDGTLSVNAGEIDLGNGDAAVAGFGSATLNATGAIVASGNGTLDFGATPVVLNAPIYVANTGSGSTLRTTGELDLNAGPGTALQLGALGGSLSFVGGTIHDNGAMISAPAGNVGMEAIRGDLTIDNGATVDASGVALPFFDVFLYAPAGSIKLTSDAGTINVAAGTTLDFAGTQGGGGAGSLSLSAPEQTVNLGGTIEGSAAAGFTGGAFSIDTGGAIDLGSLAGELASSGVNDQISVQSGAGNLVLAAGETLTAHSVTLTANGGLGGQNASDGNVVIDGTINAAGNAGGQIDLYGKSGVDLEGSLLATGSSPTQRGGTVNIGTTAIADTQDLDSTYGFEKISAANSGSIVLGAASKIDVSGGTAGGLSGGTVNIRAPIVEDSGGAQSVNVTIQSGAQINGSRATTLEPYAVWSTDDQGTDPGRHFDGVVDPAGWFDSNGQLVAGTFTQQGTGITFSYTPDGTGGGVLTDSSGRQIAVTADQLQNGIPADSFGGLEADFFSPATSNEAHQTFYGFASDGATPGTLMGFVQNGVQGIATQFENTSLANFVVAPGIELDNPDPAINGGNILVVSNWNLGAGSSTSSLDYRFLFNGAAPIITFRAENNVKIGASLTDGFFQIANPVNPGVQASVYAPYPTTFDVVYGLYANTPTGTYQLPLSYYGQYSGSPYSGKVFGPGKPVSSNSNPDEAAEEVAEYYALYEAYADFLLAPAASVRASPGFSNIEYDALILRIQDAPVSAPLPPSARQQHDTPALYLKYLSDYSSLNVQEADLSFFIGYPVPPIVEAVDPIQAGIPGPGGNGSTVVVSTPAVTDNTPSPVINAANPLPLQSASLAGGSSTTFRLVAGANAGSADPLALQAASLFTHLGTGDVSVSNHFSYVDSNNLVLLEPTMVRTGTGSIQIAAANDFLLTAATPPNPSDATPDVVVPGVVYTAGAPATGAPAGGTASLLKGNTSQGDPDIYVSPTVNPEGAGDILINAQNNIVGVENVIDTNGAVSGVPGANIDQFWWQWMETGNPGAATGAVTQSSINFGAFDQGIMSVGGNVTVQAGGDITDLGVSLPTSWYAAGSGNSINTVGGGNLTVSAGGSIVSGEYFVASGTGTLTAGNAITSDGLIYTVVDQNKVGSANPNDPIGTISTLLATQDGVFNVSARQGADIAGVVNPSYVSGSPLTFYGLNATDRQPYSSTSAVNVTSTTGDVDFGTLGSVALIGGKGSASGAAQDLSYVLPATLDLAALTGGISVEGGGDLFPSATGNLSLIADQSINLSGQNNGFPMFGLLDLDPSLMPSPTSPADSVPTLTSTSATAHAQSALHADDPEPVRLYSLNGSIVDGALQPAGAANAGFYASLVTLDVDKPALIEAGQDIVNLAFQGQNLREDDITRILAGRDIYDTPLVHLPAAVPELVIGGPGTFDIEAGRNIGPLTNQQQAFQQESDFSGATTGIDAVGNANNPNLPHESANINVLFGIGPGLDLAGFLATYVDPAAAATAGVPGSAQALVNFMEQYDAGRGVDTGLVSDQNNALNAVGPLSVDQAWTQFQALPSYVQRLFAEQALFGILTDVGNGFNDPASPFFQKYEQGYRAINTLFPASLGYTANDLSGGVNGGSSVQTGNLDIRSTTIQTQQGGNVSILGPGGQALVGSTVAPPELLGQNGLVVAGPGTMGILTLEKGDIDIFTDQSLLLAQSRVFTEQGGDMTIWSSNGDINAGKGSKSNADVPPPLYVCDVNHYCTVDARGEVSGAGIATLHAIPGVPQGTINLIAPRGTVDAGDAGIRADNINVAALHVANAANIQVQGKATGIPSFATIDTGALTAATAATSAVTQMAQKLATNNAYGGTQRRWVISVEVEGFGNSGDAQNPGDPRKKRKEQGD